MRAAALQTSNIIRSFPRKRESSLSTRLQQLVHVSFVSVQQFRSSLPGLTRQSIFFA